MSKKIAVLVGSIRKGSLNRKMAAILIAHVPAVLQLELVKIDDLPLYNQDLDDEGNPPAAWKAFREQIKASKGVLFVTPEYNRSVPGVLKNALDVGSRPYGKSVWDGKPGAVISLSPGAIGGFGANQHLRQSLVTLNVPTLPAPEMYIGHADKLFNAKGEIENSDVNRLVQQFIDKYIRWIEALSNGA
jgi:chromate reductase